MNPAETYARLKLLELALKRVLPKVAEEADRYRESVRAKTLETDHGTVTTVKPKPAISLDPDGFLRWVRAHRPDELLEHVNPAFQAAFVADLQAVGDEVVDKSTGEVVEFAHVHHRRPYLTTKLTEESKNAAEAQIIAAVEAWNPLEVDQ